MTSAKGSPEPQGLSAWLAVLIAKSVVADRLESSLDAAAGMSLGWYEVLVRLASAPDGSLPMNQLARSLVVSKSGVTRMADRMVEAGLVERRACASDRRIVYACITTEGRERLSRAVPVHNRVVEESFTAHMSADEQRALRSALAKVIAGNGMTEAPCVASAAEVRKPKQAPAR